MCICTELSAQHEDGSWDPSCCCLTGSQECGSVVCLCLPSPQSPPSPTTTPNYPLKLPPAPALTLPNNSNTLKENNPKFLIFLMLMQHRVSLPEFCAGLSSTQGLSLGRHHCCSGSNQFVSQTDRMRD